MASRYGHNPPLEELEARARKLRELAGGDFADEVDLLQDKARELVKEVFERMSPIQRVRLSRHPQRPYTLDYLGRLFTDWVELHGDRRFGDDAAIVGGLATYHGRSVVVLGHQKGRGTRECVKRNFGMPNPEGYRKASRLYEMADRFGLPVITFIDTPGAFPGVEAEERGQSEAIGHALEVMAGVGVPIVSVVIGEGGSGGALALGISNRLLMLEYSYYSVITPEGCAAILWKNADQASEAADQLRLTPDDLLQFGILDPVIVEPAGGAHRDPDLAAQRVDHALQEALLSLDGMSPDDLRDDRYRRFRQMGAYLE